MNKEYRDFYDKLTFTPEQKEQIAGLAERNSGTGRKKHTVVSLVSRVSAAAACLLCVLTVTAEASGIPTPVSGIIGPLFGGSVAQCEVIDKIGRPIDAGDTDNGITVSAEAIIGDQYNACIIFSFRRDDGAPILPEGIDVRALQMGGFGEVDLIRMGGSHGSWRFVDTVPGDDEIHYLYSISADEPLNRGTAKVHFEDLYCYPEFSGQSVKVLEGNWKFRFEVDYEDSAVSLGGGESFQQGGMNFTITDIQLSPIAVRVSYEVDSEVQWSDGPDGRLPEEDRRQMERYLENVELVLTKKDGTVIDLSLSAGGSIRPEDGKTYCVKGTVLDEILPLEELESICVGGILYPVS